MGHTKGYRVTRYPQVFRKFMVGQWTPGFWGVTGGTSSQPCGVNIKRGPIQSFNIREGANIPLKGIDPYMFPSKQKSIKSLFSTEGAKKVGKAISKFFLLNGIPFNATNNGPYYQYRFIP